MGEKDDLTLIFMLHGYENEVEECASCCINFLNNTLHAFSDSITPAQGEKLNLSCCEFVAMREKELSVECTHTHTLCGPSGILYLQLGVQVCTHNPLSYFSSVSDRY